MNIRFCLLSIFLITSTLLSASYKKTISDKRSEFSFHSESSDDIEAASIKLPFMFINIRKNRDWSQLHLYAAIRSVEGVKGHLKDGVNTASKSGNTPLHVVIGNYSEWAARDCAEIIELLCKAGAQVNRANKDGITPYTLANSRKASAEIRGILKKYSKLQIKEMEDSDSQ